MTNETVVFDNSDNHIDWYKEALRLLKESFDEGEEISESAICNQAAEMESDSWTLEKERLVDFFGDTPVLFAADIGLWDGHHRGGRFGKFETLLDKFLNNMDSFSIVDRNGHLFINAHHHDGSNSAEVMLVSREGVEKVWEKFEVDLDRDELSDEEIHVFLEEAKELTVPCFANKVYGTQLTK